MNNFLRSISTIGRILILVLTFFYFTPDLYTQDVEKESYEVKITLQNGQEFTGVLKEENDSRIILIVKDVGEMTIERSRIVSIKSVLVKKTETDDKGFVIDYHNSNRYLINPSGYGLKKGQSYYENIYIFFNSFSFGITDRFTISVGGEVASLLFAGDKPILYASPRFNFDFGNDAGAFSIGTIFFTIPENDLDGIGMAQAALTLGSRNNNINFGFGVGYSTDNDNTVLMFNFSATQRLSRKISLVTDNFVFTDGGFDDDGDNIYVLSAAVRIHFSKPGAALNVGLWRPLEDLDELLAIPMISATIPIN